jgi:glucose/arabinose dehydrogenase
MQRLPRKLSIFLIVCAIFLAIPAQALTSHGSSRLTGSMPAGLHLVASGLTSPVHLVEAPDGSGRLFIVDQIGLIRILDEDGELLNDPFLDVRDRMVTLSPGFDERGLLGMAFHPDYAESGRFFVYYSAPLRPGGAEGFNHTSHVSEFTVFAGDPNHADPISERILLQVDQPQVNNNAGMLAFGPDGYLYISLGDGGGANDVGFGHTPTLGNGQDATNLLGSILRIDVDSGDPYGIPEDNPFVGTIARDEIFAYGFRNPYRFSFDMGGSQQLFAADAGQNLWQEVSIVEAGGNFGWNIKEGTHCFDPDNPNVSPAECPDTGPLFDDPLIDPVIEYGNIRVQPDIGLGVVVVGGYVYRGDTLPQFHGRYIFGDWSTSFGEADGRVFVSRSHPNQHWQIQEIRFLSNSNGRLGHYLLGFGQDQSGEVYVLTGDETGPTGDTGRVYRLVPPGAQGR